MDSSALGALPVEHLASYLKIRLESSLRNGQNNSGFSFSSVLAIEEDLTKSLSAIRWIRNTFAPINRLHPELIASITTFSDDPSGGTADCADLQLLCAAVCRHWRNSLLTFPGVWSRVDSSNPRHIKLYLPRSKESPLHVSYGWTTQPDVFKRYVIPERHRLRSLSIPFKSYSEVGIPQSLVEPAESLRVLDMWMADSSISPSPTAMGAISRFAPNITVLTLHDILANLSSLEFPSLVKLVLRATTLSMDVWEPDSTTDLIEFLRHSPVLEELDLCLPDGLKANAPIGTVTLQHLKSAVFNGSSTPSGSVEVKVLPYLKLPEKSLTVDVQTRARAFTSCTSPLLSVTQLGHSIFPHQSITAAAIHIKDDPNGFYGHIGIRGERDNWIGLNHVRILKLGKNPLARLRDWLDPANLGPIRGIQTLTLSLFEFTSHEEQSIEVLRTFLRALDRVRVLNIYKTNVALVARILQPSDDGTVLFPLLEELNLHPYDPPELTRCVARDKARIQSTSNKKIDPPQESREDWEIGVEESKLRDRRFTLQKVFLSGKEPIKEEDMHACDKIFEELEDNDEMTITMLCYSKIGKVVRHIEQKDDLPFKEKFRFQERAKVLVEQWWRLFTIGFVDYAKGFGFCGLGDMDAISPILHEMMMARKRCGGTIGGLDKVVIEDGTGRTTVVTSPFS